MKNIPNLNPGDIVEIIAPSSRCSDEELNALTSLLESWQLDCVVPPDIFNKDLLCANTDKMRFNHLKNALQNPQTKAIICARGGYGSMRLIPHLATLSKPPSPKIFVGMSDVTALHLYFQKQWHWPTIHGALSPTRFSPESISALKAILFGETEKIELSNVIPLNKSAKKNKLIQSSITGGNLSLIQAGIGTTWQIESRNKIIFLEEIGERGYRIDRMLEHLSQANIFKEAAAILFGDFLEGKESDGSSLVDPVLTRFADNCDIPVLRKTGIGHGYVNFPILLGTSVELQLGNDIKCEII